MQYGTGRGPDANGAGERLELELRSRVTELNARRSAGGFDSSKLLFDSPSFLGQARRRGAAAPDGFPPGRGA